MAGVAARADHHVVLADRFHQLVEAGAERPGDQHQLVDGDTPVAGLDAAEGGRAELAAGSEGVKRPAAGEPQPPDPGPDGGIESIFLRHWQDSMPLKQGAHSVGA